MLPEETFRRFRTMIFETNMQNGEVFLKEHCGKLIFVVAGGSA